MGSIARITTTTGQFKVEIACKADRARAERTVAFLSSQPDRDGAVYSIEQKGEDFAVFMHLARPEDLVLKDR